MKRIELRPASCLLFGALCIAIAGCGQTEDDKGGGRSAVKSGSMSLSMEDLQQKIGDYMPTQAGGLQIAAPRGWEWGSRVEGYFVCFRERDARANDLPRILVAVVDSPFPSLSDVNEENVGQLVDLVKERLGTTKLKGTVEPIILGNTACARYVEMRKKVNALVAVQTLQTVARGRLYTIRLDAFDRQFTKYRDMGYAVAASIEFVTPETSKAAPEVGQGTETTDPSEASPTTDAAEAADSTVTDSE